MYFNHAFEKMFPGTQLSGVGAGQNANPNLTDGFLTLAGVPSVNLANIDPVTAANNFGPGSYGFFDPSTWNSVDITFVQNASCCPLILASASVMANDKIGPFHGGYKESNKSKIINPKYISHFYRVDPCAPQQSVVSIGATNYTGTSTSPLTFTINAGGTGYGNGTFVGVATTTGGAGTGLTVDVTVAGGIVTAVAVNNYGSGYVVGDSVVLTVGTGTPALTHVPGVVADIEVATVGVGTAGCCFEFLCGETYFLRVDVKGSPALRFLNHNSYYVLDFNTGCCAGPVPTAVDSTLVMIGWAEQTVTKEYLKNFVFPVVYDETGKAWFPPGSTVTPLGAAISSADWWSAYVSPGHTPGACAGLRFFGAYVDTQFTNCSFQLTDYYEKEPLKILASMVDETGDPCTFTGICVVQECPGLQGMGFGDTIAKKFILSQEYLQNHFSPDVRIREITQGDQILGFFNRNARYYTYAIVHNIPRLGNPTGQFDNDRYLLTIVSSVANAAFEAFMAAWLSTCTNCVTMETFDCPSCPILPA